MLVTRTPRATHRTGRLKPLHATTTLPQLAGCMRPIKSPPSSVRANPSNWAGPLPADSPRPIRWLAGEPRWVANVLTGIRAERRLISLALDPGSERGRPARHDRRETVNVVLLVSALLSAAGAHSRDAKQPNTTRRAAAASCSARRRNGQKIRIETSAGARKNSLSSASTLQRVSDAPAISSDVQYSFT